MGLKNLENYVNSGWGNFVVSSLKGTFDSDNGVLEVPLDLERDSVANNICQKYFENFNEEIRYEYRNDLYYFRK